MSKTKVKISGGMDRKWMSKIRSSDGVKKVVDKAAENILDEADSDISSIYTGHEGGYHYHYKSRKLKDKGWGETHIIYPTSNIAKAKKNKKVLISAGNKNASRKKK